MRQILHATLEGYAVQAGKSRPVYVIRLMQKPWLAQDQHWQAVQEVMCG